MMNNQKTKPSNASTPASRHRLPAEWERQDAIMLVWPHEKTDWSYMLDEVRLCFSRIIRAINDSGERVILIIPEHGDPQLPEFNSELTQTVAYPTNDTWARDICAITTFVDGIPAINDFKFNGWGLKFAADLDNLLTSSLFDKGIFNGTYSNHLNFVLEGGSIESDGNALLLTTGECLLSKNRNGAWSQQRIEEYLKAAFGTKKVLWLDHGYLEGDDTDSHIDTLARLAPNGTILYVATDRKEDTHYTALKNMERQLESFTNLDGKKFNLVKLPLPAPVFDEDGNRLPATYANFLIGNGFVLVPTYAQPEYDKLALSTIATVFPERKIIGIDCNALIKQHGSLHCITMQFPSNTLKYGKND